jgi:hypothetical protein
MLEDVHGGEFEIVLGGILSIACGCWGVGDSKRCSGEALVGLITADMITMD